MNLSAELREIGEELKALDAHRSSELTVDRLLAQPTVVLSAHHAVPTPTRPFVRVLACAAAVVVGLFVWRLPGEATREPQGPVATSPPETTLAAPAIPAGVAMWTFDDVPAGTATELNLGSGVEEVVGRHGNALHFDGAWPSSAEQVAPIVDTTASFSVSTFVKPDAIRDCLYQSFVSQDGATVSGFEVGMNAACTGTPPAFMFVMYDADSDASVHRRLMSETTAVADRWYHVVAVHDVEAHEMRLYVDGRLESTGPAPAKWSATGPFALGRARFSAQERDYFAGTIDTTTVFDRALTAEEVALLWRAPG